MTSLRTTFALGLLVAALLLAAAVEGRDPSRGVDVSGAGDPASGPSTGGDGGRTVSSIGAPSAADDATTTTERPPATGLDPGLQAAFDQAQQAAAAAGHTLVINSGFRTPEHQQELLDQEVAERGSLEAAIRWVLPPDRSMHVKGLAIDVGDGPAADWLAANGAPFGICHTLDWEWWHFEWRARWAASGSCPAEAHDPSEAPPV